MRAVIRTNEARIEFSGRGQVWNELLRPHLGGPEAPSEQETPDAPAPAAAARSTPPVHLTPHRTETSPAAPPARPAYMPQPAAQQARPAAAPAQPRTWYPPREQQQPRRFEPSQDAPPAYYSAEEDEPEGVKVEPSPDPGTLYGRLAALPGRRSERDAVLAAVWFLTKGEREASSDEVERQFESFRAFPDVKVVPHLMKHVHRTKMLEFGATPKAVRLSKKGLAYVHGRLVGE